MRFVVGVSVNFKTLLSEETRPNTLVTGVVPTETTDYFLYYNTMFVYK